MNHLTKLFTLVELTRSMPQYGYALAGIPLHEQSTLAAHHYLTTFIAWQLARAANQKGATLDVEQVLTLALVHDLGELFGGDIAMPYARANQRAYRLAKQFETENQRFLARFFGPDAKQFQKLGKEILKPRTDEAIIAKLADYIECTQYKFYVRRMVRRDLDLVLEKGAAYVKRLKDRVARTTLHDFLRSWVKELPRYTTTYDILEP